MTGGYEGLLIDVGGVLTTDIFPSFDAYLAREGSSITSFREFYFDSPEAREMLHRLERGQMDEDEGRRRLAHLLGLPADREATLFEGLYHDVQFIEAMTGAVEALHARGVRTGVLSNSWWFAMYDRPFYGRAFDVQLVSGRLGVRKPERAMFERGIEQLGVAPERIVFVDDFEENLPPAQALGLHTVLHDPDHPQRTIEELERLFELGAGSLSDGVADGVGGDGGRDRAEDRQRP